MYDIITKEEYFNWLDQGLVDDKKPHLKNIQDAFILSQISKHQGCKIAEIGGGQSRVLEKLWQKNECWNIDKLEGLGAGLYEYKTSSNVRLVRAYLGDFDQELPDSYFDVVFSISVIEHVPDDRLNAFFCDMNRILKPGGLCIHAIDAYLGDEISQRTVPRIDLYLKISSDSSLNLQLFQKPAINANTTFRSHYASNSDIVLYSWNKIVPGAMTKIRTQFQSVSIKAIWKKSSGTLTSNNKKNEANIKTSSSGNKASKEKEAIENKHKIVIYQMGKVGSSTIVKTLKKAKYQVHHIHHLNNTRLEGVISQYRSKGLAPPPEIIEPPKAVRELMENSNVCNFLTLVREPITRNMSAFFQNLDVFVPKTGPTALPDVNELIKTFLNEYPHDVPLTWFDNEIKQELCINVYQYPFPKEKGYLYIKKKNYRLLIIKLEVNDTTKIKALSEFLGIDHIKLHVTNIAKDKHYANIYQKFKNKITLPREYVDKMCNSKFTKHFYTDEEINQIRLKWIKT